MTGTESRPERGILTAIIVAAGYSFRMKQFKPLLPLGGITVIEQAVHSFLDNGFKDIRVVVGHRGNELFPLLENLGVRIIVNTNYSEGMFSSVQAGVKSLTSETAGFFLLPADNPLIKRHTLEMMEDTFFSKQESIVYPSFQGERGHPPLIPSCYVNDILKWNKPGGLRAMLEQYDDDAVEVQVEDSGVLLDMDTPEDYCKLLDYIGDTLLPSEEECYEIIKKTETPLKVIKHSKQVAALCCVIGSCLRSSGCRINLDLIKAAALLHDLAKGQPHHAQVGSSMLMNYPMVAKIVAEHTDICTNIEQTISEKEVVYLADKFVKDEQIVSLKDRFAGPLEQHQNDPDALEKIQRRYLDAEWIKTKIEKIINMPLSELLS
ncbi:molybdenum cofactor cytidylyltransferase [Desulfosporosinus acididurans]|uniref:Molybdenum cofactor cytidylyltransferase n=1 Tax=Desulfosporosinus acididurans TaxID=476652 RepID=A0A0J1FL66_9FIRM|nr:NTP transferase domain-containing protein [Desulfosporosinus acididurans]KLU64225.1 molybdenum cofactor cytidylyltransferase [Desulfosporosinus acididurans]